MIKLPPFDKIGTTPAPDFVNASPQSGIAGSIVNGAIFNAVQYEMQNLIAGSGLTPTDSDYTQLLQALATGIFVGTFGGTSDALSATIPGSVTIPAVKSGTRITGFIQSANTTTSPTLAVAGFTTGSGNTPVKRRDGSAAVAGDLAVGTLVTFRFDGTNWRVDGIVASDIAALLAARGTLVGVQFITSTGTYTKTAGANKALVFAVGGGGSGGAGTGGTGSNGGGAGAGGLAVAFVNISGLSTVACTIGAGGAAQTSGSGLAGNTGGTTSFGTYAVATGGSGGYGVNTGTTPRGAPGLGTTGLALLNGGPGDPNTGGGQPGNGGNGFFGGGGLAGPQTGTPAAGAGSNGGGGAGGPYNTNGPSGPGGNGAILVLEFA